MSKLTTIAEGPIKGDFYENEFGKLSVYVNNDQLAITFYDNKHLDTPAFAIGMTKEGVCFQIRDNDGNVKLLPVSKLFDDKDK
jgi:hypothetical protein